MPDMRSCPVSSHLVAFGIEFENAGLTSGAVFADIKIDESEVTRQNSLLRTHTLETWVESFNSTLLQ